MKLLKIITILGVLILVIGAILMTSSRQAETKEESFTIPISLPDGMILREVNDGERPALAEFVMESDYVAIVTRDDVKAIAKKDKKPVDSKEFDMSEWMAGTLYSLKVERVLFSKKAFLEGLDIGGAVISTLDVVTKTGGFDEHLSKSDRYLVFLQEVPKDDDLLRTLELDRSQRYYRTFVGSQSIFPERPDPMHGSNKRGRINLTEGKYAKLVRNIEVFSEALATGDENLRTQKLQRLTEVSDDSLRSNAEFALKTVSN